MKVRLFSDNELPELGAIDLDFFGRPALALREDGELRVYANVCMHLGGPLSYADGKLTCAWHGACFNALTGKTSCGPARDDARLLRLPVMVEAGEAFYVYGE